jgi:hypothetical protein
MHLTISISDGNLSFKKPLNLYIPLKVNSSHRPAVAAGLIFGNIFIFTSSALRDSGA